MNLIAEVANRESKDLQERLESYESTVMILPHNGDLPEIEGFKVVRVSTIHELASITGGDIVCIDDDSYQLAEIFNKYPDMIGFNVVVLNDVPGQVTATRVAAQLGLFHQLSFLRIVNDIADRRLVESNMTEEELQLSAAKRQDSLLRTKSGDIRPLMDFDRGYSTSENEEGVAPDADDKQ